MWYHRVLCHMRTQYRVSLPGWRTIEGMSDLVYSGLMQSLNDRYNIVDTLGASVSRTTSALLVSGRVCTAARVRELALVVARQGVFVVVTVLSHMVVYRPIVRQLDQAMKRNRGMLLLFPEEVVHSVTAIFSMMREYTKSAARA